jgi:hypothetical protein
MISREITAVKPWPNAVQQDTNISVNMSKSTDVLQLDLSNDFIALGVSSAVLELKFHECQKVIWRSGGRAPRILNLGVIRGV